MIESTIMGKNQGLGRPSSFGCVYAQVDDERGEAMLVCVYGVDPLGALPLRRVRGEEEPFPSGSGVEMSGWQGGSIDEGGLGDFVAFGVRAGSRSRAPLSPARQRRLAHAFVAAGVDYQALAHGAPRGPARCVSWIDRRGEPEDMDWRVAEAKRMLAAAWEREALEVAMDGAPEPSEAPGGSRRI
jgi:hypothetical protein